MNRNKAQWAADLLATIVRAGIGGLFLLFGAVKAIEPLDGFYQSIADYRLVPDALIEPFAVIVIALEIVFGLFLLVGLFTKWSNRVILILLGMFIIAIAQAIFRGLELTDCGCSGSLISLGETPAQVITRDILMVAALLILEVTRRYGWTLDRFFSQRKDEKIS